MEDHGMTSPSRSSSRIPNLDAWRFPAPSSDSAQLLSIRACFLLPHVAGKSGCHDPPASGNTNEVIRRSTVSPATTLPVPCSSVEFLPERRSRRRSRLDLATSLWTPAKTCARLRGPSSLPFQPLYRHMRNDHLYLRRHISHESSIHRQPCDEHKRAPSRTRTECSDAQSPHIESPATHRRAP